MRNPLLKRLPREFLHDFPKYLAIFLFMSATISFISGFLVASRNLQIEYDHSFERYNVEDGHFVLTKEITDRSQKVCDENEIKILEDFYIEEEVESTGDGKIDSTLRIFPPREKINRADLLKGSWPKEKDEIILDRLYMNNNHLSIGDTIQVGKKEIRIVGIVALSDYSAMYQDNNQFMFDATKFGVAMMSQEGFDQYGKNALIYSYAWKYNTFPDNEKKEKEVSEDLAVDLLRAAIKDDMELDIFLPRYENQAIQYAGDDLGSDRPMMEVLLYILIVIIAFVFAITVNHTIDSEANVIGTLRASGYTKGEIFRHYLAMPMSVTVLASVAGNILGYTTFGTVAANLYLGSYDLTHYVEYFYPEAFVKTTILPLILMFVVISISIWRKLSFSPLAFLRRDITRKKRSKAVRLPRFSFMNRFRLRILLQNMSNYITLLIGVTFAALLLMFGLLMRPMLNGYTVNALESKPADYQYILSSKQEVKEEGVEKFCISSLKMIDDFYAPEDISIYGIQENSQYFKDLELPEEGVVISNDIEDKYNLHKGDVINLKEPYDEKIYAFRIKGVYDFPSNMAMFMAHDYYCETFAEVIERQTESYEAGDVLMKKMMGEANYDYYNGYFSDKPLDENVLKKDKIASVITDDDLTQVSRQMDISMGSIFGGIKYFALILFALLIYLLTKIILEKNTNSISMTKILGYSNSEIAGLYLMSSVWAVIGSSIVAIIFNRWFFGIILIVFMKEYPGYFRLVVSPWMYLLIFALMVATYLLIAVVQFFKIKRIPMDEALKNVE